MGQTRGETTQNVAERLCWEVARRDDSRVARRLYRTQVVDGVYRLDEGGVRDDFFHFLQAIGVMTLLEEAHCTDIQREMVPFVQYVLLYGLQTLFGIESINALPNLLFSDEALMQLVGCNGQQVRHGQGKTAWTERLATEVVGITGLTTYDQYGTSEHGHHANRRDFQANPINAVVVRQWQGKDYGPGGKTVLLTNAPVGQPLRPFDDDDDRSFIENCCIKEAKQQWELGHPPQKTARAVRLYVVFTLLMLVLATAYRLQCEREAMGGEPVGWQRWRRQLLEQTRDKVIVFAEGHSGIFPLAEYSLLLGVKLKDVPPEIGSRQQVLARYGLPARG